MCVCNHIGCTATSVGGEACRIKIVPGFTKAVSVKVERSTGTGARSPVWAESTGGDELVWFALDGDRLAEDQVGEVRVNRI